MHTNITRIIWRGSGGYEGDDAVSNLTTPGGSCSRGADDTDDCTGIAGWLSRRLQYSSKGWEGKTFPGPGGGDNWERQMEEAGGVDRVCNMVMYVAVRALMMVVMH